MIISTREAFLGKRPLPKPDTNKWKLVKPIGETEWTPEFCELKDIKPTERYMCSLDVYPDYYEFKMSINDNWGPGSTRYEMFYREDGNIMYINNTAMHVNVNVPATLDYLGKLTVDEIKKLEDQKLPPELLK